METYSRSTAFSYDHSSEIMAAGDRDSGVLDIFVHRARNIHNICIYDNQDVYAKFSLTCSPDETISTTIIAGGGKNPEFNESLRMKITHNDAVLKCEIWMLSRARNFLEDQLLGFVLVPLSSLAGKGKLTQEFTLSSTDLFHSPAGTVKLTLFLATSPAFGSFSDPTNSSISSEVVLLDRNGPDDVDPVDQYGRVEFPDMNIVTENYKMVSEYIDMAARGNHPAPKPGISGPASFLHLGALVQPVDQYGRVEFPDMNIVTENYKMVSEYIDMAARGNHPAPKPGISGPASFLHLGALVQPVEDYEMTLNPSEGNCARSVSPKESFQASVFGSTTTSLGDERTSGDSLERKSQHGTGNFTNSSAEPSQSPEASPETPTSNKGTSAVEESKDPNFLNKAEETVKQGKTGTFELGTVFTAPLGNINIESAQSAMQQQIVDMYMRSMHQFTESLPKMKLPMDLDKSTSNDHKSVVVQAPENGSDGEKRKDGSRVFYGSRAFF